MLKCDDSFKQVSATFLFSNINYDMPLSHAWWIIVKLCYLHPTQLTEF